GGVERFERRELGAREPREGAHGGRVGRRAAAQPAPGRHAFLDDDLQGLAAPRERAQVVEAPARAVLRPRGRHALVARPAHDDLVLVRRAQPHAVPAPREGEAEDVEARAEVPDRAGGFGFRVHPWGIGGPPLKVWTTRSSPGRPPSPCWAAGTRARSRARWGASGPPCPFPP